MNIIKAAELLKNGKKICRPNWVNGAHLYIDVGVMDNKCVFLHTSSGYSSDNWQIRLKELLADDWMEFKDRRAREMK